MSGPEWQDFAQGIILLAAAVGAAGLLWKVIRRFVILFDRVSHIADEVSPNSGKTMRDAIQRIEDRQIAQREDIIKLTERTAVVEDYVGELKHRDRRRLREHDRRAPSPDVDGAG